jgi:hypothetical protein
MAQTVHIGKSEIRLDDSGEVDEVVICDSQGECLLHLEYMADNLVWSAVYKDDEAVFVNFSSRGKIKGTMTRENAADAGEKSSRRAWWGGYILGVLVSAALWYIGERLGFKVNP